MPGFAEQIQEVYRNARIFGIAETDRDPFAGRIVFALVFPGNNLDLYTMEYRGSGNEFHVQYNALLTPATYTRNMYRHPLGNVWVSSVGQELLSKFTTTGSFVCTLLNNPTVSFSGLPGWTNATWPEIVVSPIYLYVGLHKNIFKLFTEFPITYLDHYLLHHTQVVRFQARGETPRTLTVLYFVVTSTKRLVRQVTAPISSFDEAWNVHPILGFVSAAFTLLETAGLSYFAGPLLGKLVISELEILSELASYASSKLAYGFTYLASALSPSLGSLTRSAAARLGTLVSVIVTPLAKAWAKLNDYCAVKRWGLAAPVGMELMSYTAMQTHLNAKPALADNPDHVETYREHMNKKKPLTIPRARVVTRTSSLRISSRHTQPEFKVPNSFPAVAPTLLITRHVNGGSSVYDPSVRNGPSGPSADDVILPIHFPAPVNGGFMELAPTSSSSSSSSSSGSVQAKYRTDTRGEDDAVLQLIADMQARDRETAAVLPNIVLTDIEDDTNEKAEDTREEKQTPFSSAPSPRRQ